MEYLTEEQLTLWRDVFQKDWGKVLIGYKRILKVPGFKAKICRFDDDSMIGGYRYRLTNERGLDRMKNKDQQAFGTGAARTIIFFDDEHNTVIQTKCLDEPAFIQDFAKVVQQLVLQREDLTDTHLGKLMRQGFDIVGSYRGYKTDVHQIKTIVAGRSPVPQVADAVVNRDNMVRVFSREELTATTESEDGLAASAEAAG